MLDTGLMIRECRIREGLSVPQLADLADTSTQALYVLEKKTNCQVDTLEKILNALGYELEIVRMDGSDM
jgi:predicted transcriptional regulator